MARFDSRSETGLTRGMFRLALPVLVEESLMMAVGYTDWWLTGHYLPGAAAQAAMGLMAYLLWLLPSMFAAWAIGVTAVVARRFGEGRPEEANLAAHQALATGAIAAGIATYFAVTNADQIPIWLQLQGESAEYASRYFGIVAAVLPLIMVEQVIIAALRGAGDTTTGLLAKAVVVIVNLVLSTGLVTGWGPFPKLGWEGLAVGTAAAHGTGGLLLAAVFLRGRFGIRCRWSAFRWDGAMQRLLLKIGFPGGADIAAILFFQFLFVAIVNRLGDTAAAAHGLAVQIEALAYMPGSAFQVAAATMAGQYLGAGAPQMARRSTAACLLAGGAVTGSAALFFAYQGESVTRLFLNDDASAIAEQAARLLVIVSAGLPALTLCMIGSGTLRGSGDTHWPLAITLTGFALVRTPLAILWAWPSEMTAGWSWGLGIEGAWWAMLADLWLRGTLIGARLFHGGWQRIELRR